MLPLSSSLPNLNHAVPTACHNHGGINRMPRAGNGGSIVMSAIFLQQLAPSPIPEVYLAITIAAGQESTIGTYGNVTGISRHGVAAELLLPLEGEAILGLVHHNLVVQALSGPVLQRRVERHDGDGVHGRIGDVFDGNADIPFPN